MWSFHYTDCINAHLFAPIHHMYLLSVHHSTFSKQQFLTSGISCSLLLNFIIKTSFLTKNYLIFGLWWNFDTFNYVCILALTTLKMAQEWPKHVGVRCATKLRVVTCYYFNFLMRSLLCSQEVGVFSCPE